MQILYSIHSNLQYLFSTYDKEKADKFIKEYNKYNCNESDYYPDKVRSVVYKSSSNVKKTELNADRVINNYQYFIYLTVEYINQNDEFILVSKEKKYLDRNKIDNYKTINYNDLGYRLSFVIVEEELVIRLSYSTAGKCNKIINQSLISIIKETEDELNNSLIGNMIYIVFKKDYEYPPRLFKTFSKEKAESFVREYNQINSGDEENRVGYFSINLSQIEEEADSIIEEYLNVKKIVYIEIDKDGNSKLLKSETKFCGEDIEDIFVNVKEQSFVVTFTLDKDYPIDLKDSVIVNKIKELKEKHYYLFDKV